MIYKNTDNQEGRSHYSEGILPKKFKDTSVKKLHIISAFPNVPERYENLKSILDDLNIEAVDFSISADIKMLLILIGKPCGKPKFNCPFCNGFAPFKSAYTLYTIGDCFAWHQAYIAAGSNAKQMDFQNFVNQPIITGPSDKLVLDLINLPSLHMLLGNSLPDYCPV